MCFHRVRAVHVSCHCARCRIGAKPGGVCACAVARGRVHNAGGIVRAASGVRRALAPGTMCTKRRSGGGAHPNDIRGESS